MTELNMKLDTKKYQANRNNYKLTDEQRSNIQEQINKIILTDNDFQIINEKINEKNISDYKNRKSNNVVSREYFIKTAYILRYKLNIITKQMASFLNVDVKMCFRNLKLLSWSYSPKEAQQLAAKESRNYSEIRIKSKQTMLLSTSKSPLEDKIREYLNLKLSELLPDCDVIVGCNNLSILYSINKEIDIPIIIFKESKTYKFAVEINGYYWHETIERDDASRKKLIKNKGYKYYEIWQCTTNEQREEMGLKGISIDLDKVVYKIIKDISK